MQSAKALKKIKLSRSWKYFERSIIMKKILDIVNLHQKNRVLYLPTLYIIIYRVEFCLIKAGKVRYNNVFSKIIKSEFCLFKKKTKKWFE